MAAAGDLSFLGGLMLGAASALHCAGMCGGIGAAMTLTFPGRNRAAVLMTAQAGRVLSYVLAGALVGAFGGAVYRLIDLATAHLALRWGAALMLAWIGLSLTGLLPPLSGFDRLLRPLTQPLARAGRAGPFLAGMAWGGMPCGIVYGALIYAMLTGSTLGGATVMAGFGLGTLPAVTLAALGITGLRRLASRPPWRMAAGLAIVGVAIASVALPNLSEQLICLP